MLLGPNGKPRPIRVYFGLLAYGGKLDKWHFTQALDLGANIVAHRNRFAVAGATCADVNGVDHARNLIIRLAMKAKADWAFMMDADTWATANVALNMLIAGEERDAAAISAPVLMRRRPGYNVWVLKDGVETILEPAEFRGRVVPVDRIGAAYMAVNLRWLARNWPRQPWFKFVLGEDEEPSQIGEDTYFSRGVRERGGAIYVDGRYEAVHEGVTQGGPRSFDQDDDGERHDRGLPADQATG